MEPIRLASCCGCCCWTLGGVRRAATAETMRELWKTRAPRARALHDPGGVHQVRSKRSALPVHPFPFEGVYRGHDPTTPPYTVIWAVLWVVFVALADSLVFQADHLVLEPDTPAIHIAAITPKFGCPGASFAKLSVTASSSLRRSAQTYEFDRVCADESGALGQMSGSMRPSAPRLGLPMGGSIRAGPAP